MSKIFNRFFALLLSGLMVLFLTVNVKSVQALTLNNNLIAAATTEEMITDAAQNFLKSLLKDYSKDTQNAFDDEIKAVKKTVNNLANLLDKAEKDSKSVSQTKIAQVLEDSQKQLGNLAKSFNGLAQKTEEYDSQLENTLENLLKLAQGQVKDNFTTNENAFKGISQAISALADDTSKAAKNKDLFSVISDLGGHINTVNQAINIADKAIKAFAG